MTDDNISKQRKIAYIAMASILFAAILGLTTFVIKQAVAASEWVSLARDVDHRMKPYDKKFFTNSDGIRSEREASSIGENDYNIIFLGDSFIYGFLLTHKEFPPPAQLETILRAHYSRNDINVWNFGWTTSSPVLELRLLKDLGKKYHPDLVILAVDMSDYRDDYFYRHLIKGDGAYEYIKKYPRTMYVFKQLLTYVDGFTGWHKDVFGYVGNGRYFAATQPLEDTRVQFDELYDSLNQVYDYCHNELHVPLLVIIPPRHWQYTDKESPNTWESGAFDALGPYVLENYRYFDEKRPATPYPLISLLDDFKNSGVFPTTFDKDSHWNQHGAKLAAEAVFNHAQQGGYFASLDPSAPRATTRADKRH